MPSGSRLVARMRTPGQPFKSAVAAWVARWQHVFAVVENQQYLPGAEDAHDDVDQDLSGECLNAETRGNGARDKGRVRHRRQLDDVDAICEGAAIRQPARETQGQSRLTGSSGSGDRDQHGVDEGLLHLLELTLAADERAELGWQLEPSLETCAVALRGGDTLEEQAAVRLVQLECRCQLARRGRETECVGRPARGPKCRVR